MSNLIEHPRCSCGFTMNMIFSVQDGSMYECGSADCTTKERMFFYHTGKKAEFCPFCSDSAFRLDPVEGEIVCPYCKGKLI